MAKRKQRCIPITMHPFRNMDGYLFTSTENVLRAISEASRLDGDGDVFFQYDSAADINSVFAIHGSVRSVHSSRRRGTNKASAPPAEAPPPTLSIAPRPQSLSTPLIPSTSFSFASRSFHDGGSCSSRLCHPSPSRRSRVDIPRNTNNSRSTTTSRPPTRLNLPLARSPHRTFFGPAALRTFVL
jgi:hypothetical protein